MKNENKRIIYNTEAAAKKPDVNPYCKVQYSLPAPCKGKIEAKCKPLCDKLGISIKELNRLCGVENGYRVELNQLLLIPGDLDGAFGNLLQKYIDAQGKDAVNKALKAMKEYLDSNTVKGNKSVNLWNLALWNLANAKDGKGGKGKNDGGKGPNNSNKDKKDNKSKAKENPKNNKDKKDDKSKAKDNKNQNKDKKDKDSKAKNNDNSDSGVSINEKAIIALIEQRRKDNKLLEAAKDKVKATEDKLRTQGCITTTTTPAPTTTPPPTSLAPQDIWFLNSSAKKQKAQIKKQRQIKKKKQRQLKNKRNK